MEMQMQCLRDIAGKIRQTFSDPARETLVKGPTHSSINLSIFWSFGRFEYHKLQDIGDYIKHTNIFMWRYKVWIL